MHRTAHLSTFVYERGFMLINGCPDYLRDAQQPVRSYKQYQLSHSACYGYLPLAKPEKLFIRLGLPCPAVRSRGYRWVCCWKTQPHLSYAPIRTKLVTKLTAPLLKSPFLHHSASPRFQSVRLI